MENRFLKLDAISGESRNAAHKVSVVGARDLGCE
jgi:hypothetical protein